MTKRKKEDHPEPEPEPEPEPVVDVDAGYVPCLVRELPDDFDHLEAAKTACEINPANRPNVANLAQAGIVLPPEHLALVTSRYWGSSGVQLTVSFMESVGDQLKARILSHMNAWGQWANVTFMLVPTGGKVRITLAGDGYWSYIGTDVLHIPASQPTMCLQDFSMSTPESEYHRVVRHETGHTLGFPHEHSRKQIVQRLDPQKTIAYFGRTQGWSADVIQQQILTPLNDADLTETPTADVLSIMCYALPASITVDGQPIPGGTDIEAVDQGFVARCYPPKAAPPPVVPPVVNPPPVNPPVVKPPAPPTGVIVTAIQIINWVIAFVQTPQGQAIEGLILQLINYIVSQKPASDEEFPVLAAQFAGMHPAHQARFVFKE